MAQKKNLDSDNTRTYLDNLQETLRMEPGIGKKTSRRRRAISMAIPAPPPVSIPYVPPAPEFSIQQEIECLLVGLLSQVENLTSGKSTPVLLASIQQIRKVNRS